MAIWFPPPPPVQLGGRQPYEPKKLPPSITAVPVNNPPFRYSGRGPETQSEIARTAWDAAANTSWPYGFVGAAGGNGCQPYAPRTLPPSITAVPVNNPPFISEGRDPIQIQNAGAVAWNAAVLAPQLPGRIAPLIPAVVVTTQVPFGQAWLASVVQSWQSPAPPAQQRIPLPPSITAVAVNEPPYDRRKFETYAELLRLWQPPDPPPVQRGPLAPAITAVAVNEPPYDRRWAANYAALVAGWRPPDPWPMQRGPLAPSITAVRVDNPPPLRLWQPPPPLETPRAQLGAQIASLIPPPVVAAAQILTPPFWQAVLAWQPAPSGIILPRYLPVAVTAVPVQNPPFVQAGRAQQQVISARLGWDFANPPWPATYIGGASPYHTFTGVPLPSIIPPVPPVWTPEGTAAGSWSAGQQATGSWAAANVAGGSWTSTSPGTGVWTPVNPATGTWTE